MFSTTSVAKDCITIFVDIVLPSFSEKEFFSLYKIPENEHLDFLKNT